MPEIPEWVSNTPDEPLYRLIMYDCEGWGVEEVAATRDEYIALKDHLAAMRGYTVGDFQKRIAELDVEGYNKDVDQMAIYLETARDFYRACPELVVNTSPELADYIRKRSDEEFEEEPAR